MVYVDIPSSAALSGALSCFSGQVQQHHARFCTDLPGGRREDSLQGVYAHRPGGHPVCWDHIFHIRNPQKAAHRYTSTEGFLDR